MLVEVADGLNGPCQADVSRLYCSPDILEKKE